MTTGASSAWMCWVDRRHQDAIPGELDDAQDVLDARDSMLQDAKTHADSMVSSATTEAESIPTTPAPRLTDPV